VPAPHSLASGLGNIAPGLAAVTAKHTSRGEEKRKQGGQGGSTAGSGDVVNGCGRVWAAAGSQGDASKRAPRLQGAEQSLRGGSRIARNVSGQGTKSSPPGSGRQRRRRHVALPPPPAALKGTAGTSTAAAAPPAWRSCPRTGRQTSGRRRHTGSRTPRRCEAEGEESRRAGEAGVGAEHARRAAHRTTSGIPDVEPRQAPQAARPQ
jgi:hypothetical protein